MEKQLSDSNVKAVITQIEAEIRRIKSRSGKFEPITNLVLPFLGTSQYINTLDLNNLKMLGSLLEGRAQLTLYEGIKLGGFQIEAWISDIDSKIIQLQTREELQMLESKKKALETLYSDKARNQQQFDQILKSLNL
jgi:hypothetical protein